jgi:hypothetical protein
MQMISVLRWFEKKLFSTVLYCKLEAFLYPLGRSKGHPPQALAELDNSIRIRPAFARLQSITKWISQEVVKQSCTMIVHRSAYLGWYIRLCEVAQTIPQHA